MKYDNGVQDVEGFLTKASEGFIIDPEANNAELFPWGWKFIISPLYILENLYRVRSSNQAGLFSVGLVKGILRVKLIQHPQIPERLEDFPLRIDMFNRVAESVARDSANKCLVCGDRGNRKKTEKYWPSLCNKHYIQYVNYLDEHGSSE